MELNEITKLVDKVYPDQINLKSFNFKKPQLLPYLLVHLFILQSAFFPIIKSPCQTKVMNL